MSLGRGLLSCASLVLLLGCPDAGSEGMDDDVSSPDDGLDDGGQDDTDFECDVDRNARISDNHGHSLQVGVDRQTDQLHFHLGGAAGHTHGITVDTATAERIFLGQPVTVQTEIAALHTHQVSGQAVLDCFDDG